MTQLDQILRALSEIRAELLNLQNELRILQLASPTPENLLRQRGYRLLEHNPESYLLLPSDPSGQALERYYRLLRRYSFRLFLRDVIRFRDELSIEKLTHYCSTTKAQRYLDALADLGIVARTGRNGRYEFRGNPQVRSFGDTLEWFVAQTFVREFRIPACWGISVADLREGGDFDVIGVLASSRLVYVETKASPPKNLHMDVVEGFVRRVTHLAPDLAILLVDTHLRMEDKINKMARAALGERTGRDHRKETVQIARGVFRLAPGVYTCNSKPAIHKNLRCCIRDYIVLNGGLGR